MTTFYILAEACLPCQFWLAGDKAGIQSIKETVVQSCFLFSTEFAVVPLFRYNGQNSGCFHLKYFKWTKFRLFFFKLFCPTNSIVIFALSS